MDERGNILRNMKICRFCLDDNGALTNIYEKCNKDGKQSVPLPLQIMACLAIEVFQNDGMPQLICNSCRNNTNQAYVFKSTCKKSDDALKLFLATGNMNILKGQIKKELHIVVTKRNAPETSEHVTEKKQKTESTILMLNSNKLLESPSMSESPIHFKGEIDSEQISEEVVEEYDHEGEESTDGEDEDNESKINPILKVPQVQTDVFPCPHCERSFPLKQLLDLHVKNHTRVRSYQCRECGRKFFTKYDLGKHVQTHSDARPFSCVVCNKQFARESLLHRHEKTHIDVPKYLCSSCDRTFLTRSDLDAHSEKHKKKRPFSCRICKKSFVFKQGLERHELTHSEEKPHKCNYCEASFTSPIKLMRHITSHAGLRPYPCKLCGRTFLLSHHLTRHMRSHYAAKSSEMQQLGQHKCDICSMSFRRKDSLINHSTIHSMVNLKCVICNTAFDNAKQVMNHITTHLSGLPYPCDKCDYSFETQDQLEEHEIKHAEMEYEEQIEQEVHQEANQLGDNIEEGDDSGDEVTEYTITNTENPEIVRRPRRATKIKNYAQFLKEELGSDIEDELINEEEPLEITPDLKDVQQDSIKPIVRVEGTKVYTRKNAAEKPRIIPEINLPPLQSAPLDQITNKVSTSLENWCLTKQAVNALPNKQYVDMKFGDKTVRVQKLMMTKAEIEAMAKEGKIEMKGDTILLKKSQLSLPVSKPFERALPFRHTMESIIDDVKPNIHKPVVKKTYLKKSAPASEADIKINPVALKINNEISNVNSEIVNLAPESINVNSEPANINIDTNINLQETEVASEENQNCEVA